MPKDAKARPKEDKNAQKEQASAAMPAAEARDKLRSLASQNPENVANALRELLKGLGK